MTSYISSIVLISMALVGVNSAGIFPAAIAAPAPVVAAAPVPLAVGYAKAVPHNVPPHVSRIDINTRNLAAPFIAAPAVAPAVTSAIAPGIAAPIVAPAALTYNPYINPYAYPANIAAPLVQSAVLG